MDFEALDFSMHDSEDNSMDTAAQPEQSTSTSKTNLPQSHHAAEETGKAKMNLNLNSGAEENGNGEEMKSYAPNYNLERSNNNDDQRGTSPPVLWVSGHNAAIKALRLSKLGRITSPKIGTKFSSASELRLGIAAYAIQNGWCLATVSREKGNKSISMTCSMNNNSASKVDFQRCHWHFRGKEVVGGSGTFEIYSVHPEHNHSMGEINIENLGGSNYLKANFEDCESDQTKRFKFPTQAIIIADAHQLIKNSTRPILQDMDLSFATATEMRTHITAFAIVNGFAQNLRATADSFGMRCYLGKGNNLLCEDACPYRFRSYYKKEKESWIVSDSKLEHNHEMGLYIFVGTKSQITEKGRIALEKLKESRSISNSDAREREESDDSEEAQETDSDGDLDNLLKLESRLRNRLSKEMVKNKKAKIIEMESPRSHPRSSTSQRFITPSATSTSAITPPVITPIPNPRIESSPEWIQSLTQLLTAIDPRLANLAPVFDNAGVQDERAVMEMMHLSDDGLEQLAQKLVEEGGGMTMMQKIQFKKGIIKIRQETF